MRSLVVLLALASPAIADKKIVDMTPGFKRELGACETEERGVALVVDKTRTFVATDPPDRPALEADLAQLAGGHALVVTYCDALRTMVSLLETHAKAAYRSVGREIDTQYRAVVAARKAGKQRLEELAPITRKLIPRLNARVGARVAAPEKKQTGKFPSGRTVELPSPHWKLGGNATSDVAEYRASGVTATVTTRPFTNATCEQQQRAFLAKAGTEPVTELDVKPHVGWRYTQRDKTPHALQLVCTQHGFIAVADITPATANADEITKLMLAMLALR